MIASTNFGLIPSDEYHKTVSLLKAVLPNGGMGIICVFLLHLKTLKNEFTITIFN